MDRRHNLSKLLIVYNQSYNIKYVLLIVVIQTQSNAICILTKDIVLTVNFILILFVLGSAYYVTMASLQNLLVKTQLINLPYRTMVYRGIRQFLFLLETL